MFFAKTNGISKARVGHYPKRALIIIKTKKMKKILFSLAFAMAVFAAQAGVEIEKTIEQNVQNTELAKLTTVNEANFVRWSFNYQCPNGHYVTGCCYDTQEEAHAAGVASYNQVCTTPGD